MTGEILGSNGDFLDLWKILQSYASNPNACPMPSICSKS